MRILRLVLALLMLGAAPVALVPEAGAQRNAPAAAPAPARTQSWANARSDLPADKDYTLGVLPNGMRYLILPNHNPPGMVALRLVIDAGSMQEQPGEEGAAHFLEHMAYRGTKRFADGEAQRSLEQLGLQMGRDANASTGSDQITVKFDMPRSDAVSVYTGLLILREMASELLLDPAALETERGVVLAEERLRADPALQMELASVKALVGDHPYGKPPIGRREAVTAMTPEVLRRYYDAYVRPERTTLVIVGDVDPVAVIPVLKGQFANWQGIGPAGSDPRPLTEAPPGAPETSMAVGDGMGAAQLRLSWWEPYVKAAPTKAERRKALVELLAVQAVNARMAGLLEAAGKPASGASAVSQNRIANVWRGWTASASGITDLSKAVDVLAQANRQAVAFGISQAELDRVVALRRAALQQAVKAGRTGTSDTMADREGLLLTSDVAYVSAADSLALFEENVRTLKLDEVNAVLKAHFSGRPTIFYSGVKAPEGGEAGLRAMVDRALAKPATAFVYEAAKPWPYADFGPAGIVTERTEAADLGVTMVKFANGVRLTVKPLSAQKNQITVRVSLGLGRLGMPRGGMDASDYAIEMWRTGGLGRLTRTELARTLAGRRVSVTPDSRDDRFVLTNNGGTTREDLGLQMQLMAAYVSDPGYRTDEWPQLMQQADDRDAGNMSTPSATLSTDLDRLLHSGDIRWAFNTGAMRHAWKPEDAVAFIRPIVANAPLEIVMAGDADVEATIAAVAATFGALPARSEPPEPPGLRDVKFPEPTPEPVRLRHTGRADQAMMLVAWPTGQGLYRNVREQRVGFVLAGLLQDHATLKFRSGEGMTYAPNADADFSAALPDYGYIALVCELPPERLDRAMQDVQDLADELAATEIDREELDRALASRVEQAKRDMSSNANWWAERLVGAQAEPSRLDVIRTQAGDYAGITAAEVRDAAAKWLKAGGAFRVEVVAR